MGASISITSPLYQRTLTLIPPVTHHQLRRFARWTPYKPLPKSKHHQKLQTLKTLKAHIQNCYLVSPFNCHGFSANQFKALKHPLHPAAAAISAAPSAKLVVAKNSLVAKAFSGTSWEALVPCMKGMNALLFVKEEEMASVAMGGLRSVVKEGKLEFNGFTGAVIGGRLYGHLDLEVLESMPSKAESDGMLLGSLYSPASSLIALLQGVTARSLRLWGLLWTNGMLLLTALSGP
ncbi:hypothetical protein Nepgr_008535 [Nepenthes gracilis]|uniref:Uncharacterized protein n=1 Tax=Nepenthes gracilis TaxID=150966 RepID=A0AAD3S8V6_NEPGR|nr:hypothetical protein Nepgr_008535 [Nepenthes gracilis]